MNTRKFLSTVWPTKGPYCIAMPWVKPNGEECFAHHGCDTIDDAIAYILLKKQSKDLYFAPHSLKVVRELNPSTGKFQTFRTHVNMKEARDFFFDIDYGGPKDHYATYDDVLSAIERFLFETGLPSPFVVNSGYGIHVHWAIVTPIESVAWKEPAARLRWLAKQHGLHVDPMRTTDQSSVLRVPGTFNLKNPDDPRKVTILAEGVVTDTDKFLDQLDNLTSEYTKRTGSVPKRSGSGDNLLVAWDGRHPSADEVADVCEHMKTFRDSQGNIPEPLWHVGIGTVKYCDDGEEKAHEWSSGYPRYTPAETQKKLDAWTVPPPGCEKIDHNSGDPAVCARCPHRDLAKNPIMIANLVYQKTHQPQPGPAPASANGTGSADPTPLCQPPAPFTLDMTYGIKMKKAGLICEWPMFPIQWVTATTNESCLSRWYVKTPRNGWKIVELLNDDLNLQPLAAALRNKDIIVLPKQLKSMQMFLQSYLRELHKYQDSLKQYDYVGWEVVSQELTERTKPVEMGDPEWFIMYGRKISVVDGSIVPCVMTRNTKLDYMGRRGSLLQQTALMNFYNDPSYMAQQFIIAASLACPFFRFSNLHGMLICLTGETGASKSTGLFFASSIWGHPELYPISGLRSNATDKGRQERGAICCNQPFMCDEITRFDPETAHEIALSATQAGSYTSLKSNRDFRDGRGGLKSNLTICTSNKSLVQLVNADSTGGQAGIMRVFEIKVDRNIVRSKTEADAALRLLVKNYGWIGEDFLHRCLPHTEAISKKFLEILEQLEADIHASQEERFMTACAAIALLGIKLGNKLGYFQFSYKAMREWLINVQIPAMRSAAKLEREHMTPKTILNEYLEEISPNMCRIDKNTRGEPEILYAPPQTEFKARYEIFKGEVSVRIWPFREYCNKHGHDYSGILDQLVADGLVTNKSVKKRMRAEARNFSSPVPCFVISVKTASPIAVPNVPDKIVEHVDFKKKH
jgi:hypothetical protein